MPGNMPYEPATYLLHIYQKEKANRYVKQHLSVAFFREWGVGGNQDVYSWGLVK